MKKSKFRCALCLVVMGASLFLAPTLSWAEPGKRVGMALWAGCEDVCKGVAAQLAAADPTIEFIPFDVARDKEKLAQLPEKAKSANLDLLLTWGTRVTRAMVGTIEEYGEGSRMGDIPVVFTVVADPVGADIIRDYEATGRTHVTGTRNRVPETVNISGLRRVLPGFDHLGLLYEPEAENSRLKFEELRALSRELGFTLTSVTLNGDDSAKLDQMLSGLAFMKAQGVQFVYLGSSTFLEVHADTFTKTATDNGLPVLSPYENLVHDSHAYMSIASRDFNVGQLAGARALEVLSSDRSAGTFPVVAMEEFAFVLNAAVAKELELFPPIDVLQFFEVVNE